MNSRAYALVLVKKAVAAIGACPPDLRENGGTDGEIQYIAGTLPSYRRTITDILELFPDRQKLSAAWGLAKRLVKTVIPGGDTQVVVFRKTAAFEGKFSVCPDS